MGSWLVLQVKTRQGTEYPNRAGLASSGAECRVLELLQLLELLELLPSAPPYHCLFEPLVPMMGRLSENGVLARVITSSMWLVFPRLVVPKSF